MINKISDRIDDAVIKSITEWGLFFEINGEIDAFAIHHVVVIKIENLNDMFEVGQKYQLKSLAKMKKNYR